MAKELSLAEQLCYITTRIETINTKGDKHIATGFFMGYRLEDGSILPLLVTNRHVADDANQMDIFLTEKDANGDPIDNMVIRISIENAKNSFIFHPDSYVDLAVLPVYQFIVKAETKTGKNLYYRTFPSDMLITDDMAKDLDAIEDVVMIGYPNALWDAKNNRPIFRHGITATDPKLDYENKREFMIDCACIQGSSGSPVIVFYKGVYCNTSTRGLSLCEVGSPSLKVNIGSKESTRGLSLCEVGRPSLKVNIGSWCHEHRFIELRTYVQEATNIGWCKDDVRNASVHSDGTGDS